MATQPFTIGLAELKRELALEIPEPALAAHRMSGEWLGRRGEPIGAAELASVAAPPIELPDEEGEIHAFGSDPFIVSTEAAPAEATAIRIRYGGGAATFATPLADERWLTERTTAPFGGGGERFEVRVFSELFTDFARFEARVGEFHHALRQVAPFTQVEAAGKLRLVGHYARSPGPTGHFRTVIVGNPQERRIYGDRAYARTRLAPSLNAMPALILMDSDVGGGAGGALFAGKPYWPAWASTGSLSERASWLQVAIHELAHGFGLSDEYIDSRVAGGALPPKYDNVSNAQTAVGLSWNDLAALPAGTPLPTHDGAGASTGTIPAGRDVAAYRGAYYSNAYWRPSKTCRMRNYDPGGFCQVCSRIIRSVYAMA